MDAIANLARLLAQAARLGAEGRLPGAIAAYREALTLRPDLPNSWYNLARLERQAGRPEAALAAYDEALRRGVEGPEEVRLNRAVILLEDLDRPDEAAAELQAALADAPAYLPAWLNLGNLHEDLGDRAAARAAYEHALALQPDDTLALARALGVAELSGPDDPLLVRVRRRAAAATAGERADLGFALGAALDRLGAFDEAFEAYRDANLASRAATGARYDRARQERFVDRSIVTFAEPVASSEVVAGKEPVFICGMFRSGSTLVEQMLGCHSHVSAGGELGLIPALAAGFEPYPEAVVSAPAEAIAQRRAAYLAAARPLQEQGKRLTDKRPDNFLHIGLIKTLFPEARIVHTVRAPLDNILSLYFLHLDPTMAYALDLEDAAHWHGQYRRLMAHWKSLYADDIHEVDYDRLVREPERELGSLLNFLALPWEESCLSFHRAGNAVRTASAGQVREPLYRRSSGRWRNYERHLGPLIAALQSG